MGQASWAYFSALRKLTKTNQNVQKVKKVKGETKSLTKCLNEKC